jgi:AbrB family looped-hinge helix DNA binding protein
MKQTREFIATITSKGQVTIPASVREQLGLSPQDKVILRMTKSGKVEIEPMPMTLEQAYGSVPPLSRPEDPEAIKQAVRAAREERWIKRTDE